MIAAAVDPELPALDVLLDSAALSATLGHEVRADHLRYKPGTSVVARLTSAGEARPGWVAGYHPDYASKLRKPFARASLHGIELRTQTVPGAGGEHVLVAGPIELDTKLYEPLRAVPYLDSESARLQVLNYNPFRRLVAAVDTRRHGRVVVKVTAVPPVVTGDLLTRLNDAGVPVLEQVRPSELGDSPNAVSYPWFGASDLQRRSRDGADDGPALAARAGYALARLHDQPRTVLPEDASAEKLDAEHARRRVTAQTAAATTVAPALADGLEAVAQRLTARLSHGGRHGVVHGDFSADQVLTDDGEIRLIDLDRVGYGAVASDLGCFAAVESLGGGTTDLIDALLTGYDRPVDAQELRAWTAFHFLARILEPFRGCAPDWRGDMARRLRQIEELL